MSRWRAPRPPSTAIITRAGLLRLQAELDELWRRRRPEVVKALAAAAAEGDRSENAEYHYRKKQLAQIDRRVRYLGKRIPSLKVPPAPPGHRERVFFGARVQLRNLDNDEPRSYRLVGPDEADAACGDISIDSPLARALLGRASGEDIDVTLPAGRQRLSIEAVDYGGADASQASTHPGP